MSILSFFHPFKKQLRKAESSLAPDAAFHRRVLRSIFEDTHLSDDSISALDTHKDARHTTLSRCRIAGFSIAGACAAFLLSFYFLAPDSGTVAICDDTIPLAGQPPVPAVSFAGNVYQIVLESGNIAIQVDLSDDVPSYPLLQFYWVDAGHLYLQLSDKIDKACLEKIHATNQNGDEVSYHILSREEKVLIFNLPLTDLHLTI